MLHCKKADYIIKTKYFIAFFVFLAAYINYKQIFVMLDFSFPIAKPV